VLSITVDENLVAYEVYTYNPAKDTTVAMESNATQISDLIFTRRVQLTQEFGALQRLKGTADASANSRLFYIYQGKPYWYIDPQEWAGIMERGIPDIDAKNMAWEHLQPVLAPAEAADQSLALDKVRIHFHKFLARYQDESSPFSAGGDSSTPRKLESQHTMSKMYRNHRALVRMFQAMDSKNTGIITEEQWRAGCDSMNSALPEDERIEGATELFHLLDFDRSGQVDINKFMEASRLATSHREKHLKAMLPIFRPREKPICTVKKSSSHHALSSIKGSPDRLAKSHFNEGTSSMMKSVSMVDFSRYEQVTVSTESLESDSESLSTR